MQTAPQRPVVIKALRHDYPSFRALAQFRNQYVIAKNLAIPGIVRPLSLEPLGHGYALVMADEGGISLAAYAQQRSLRWLEILPIALQITDILHGLYQHRVIHKDIKPANLLIHPTSKAVQLIDFSIASLLPKEKQELQSPNKLEGTLAYLAPEQTGRMNRGIDYRADYYSLGCTLYQLLTGRLPFKADDPLELVHGHMAKVATPVHQLNPTVPHPLSAIVAKLMAKNAEARYQSALGLKHDLEQCWTQWETAGAIAIFDLGQRDDCDRFTIPEKLYGRATEVQALLSAFDRISIREADGIAAPPCELMLIAGFSGIGKTAVVNEVHKPITRQSGYFIKGKFDQLNSNIPFSAFAQALQDLMGQLLSESDTQLAQWRTEILAAVGENGQVLIDLVPTLEQVIGPQPPALELSGPAAQKRFDRLFQNLFAVLTKAEHPLVMFLDDLQWADAASLQLVKILMNSDRHLLLIGAYRDNEVSLTHPLAAVVEELQKSGKAVNTLMLAPLSLEDTHQLVTETLRCAKERSHLLAQFVHRKTQGNPFFITRLLKSLHADGFIQFDRQQGGWACDVTQITGPHLHDDVVEFIAQQLQKLPLPTQQVVKLAACLGNQFDLATLALISEQSATATAADLWPALQDELILPVDEAYKFFQDDAAITPDDSGLVCYKFLHDRIQQAAYSLLTAAEKPHTHLSIGRLMLEQLSQPELEHRLFDIANNISLGQALVTDPSEQSQLGQLLLKAACKARKAIAYPIASQYCQAGIDLLGSKAWQQQRALIQELYEVGAEVAYLNSDFERSAALITVVLEQAHTVLEKISSYRIKILADIIQNKTTEALETGLKILSELKVSLPSEPGTVSILFGF
ncbi:MAG: serine/threonine-protein kinase PknK, partial [Cyanobacteria bacterium P01_D01_bin.115]